jgi:DNA-binding NarL/FixJ family response regulator
MNADLSSPRDHENEAAGPRPDALRILIVDARPSVRSSLRQAVSARDLRVVGEAGSVNEAGPVAQLTQPDVILLENELRDGGGRNLVRSLAKLLPHAAIVVLAGSYVDQDAVDAMQAGAAGFLELGIGAHALQRAVRGVVHGDLAMSRHWARRVVSSLTGGNRRAQRAPSGFALTARELEVLRLLADGLTAREIGAVLGISTRTAEGHVAQILRRLGARNRAEAVRRYVEGF